MELCRCCHFELSVDSSKNLFNDCYDNKKLLDIITKITDVKIHEDDPFPKDICYHCYQIVVFICDFITLVTRTDRKFHQNDGNDESANTETETNRETIHDKSVEEIVTEVDVFCDDSIDVQETSKQDNLNIDNGSDDNSGIVDDNRDIQEIRNQSSVRSKIEHKCPICNKKFARNFNVQRHLKTQHKQNNKSIEHTDELKQQSSIQNNQFKCNVCNKVFTRRSHLIRHLSIHAIAKMFNCKICKRAYTKRSELKKHLLIHNKDKLFVCHICNKVFNRKYGLDRHMSNKTVHIRKESILCHCCNEQFDDEDSLQKHFIPAIDQDSLICKICRKHFYVKCSLNQHMLSHRGG